MSIVYETHKYRNASDTATIFIEKITDQYIWGWSVPDWRVHVWRDGTPYAITVKSGLKNKPSKKRIQQYIEEL